jgi:protein-tyrosine phosphatase
VIDLHCHLLPGIDDGPATLEESVALARAAAAKGTRTIVATPHVSARYPNAAGTISRLSAEVAGRLADEHIELEVLPGAEIAMERTVDLSPEDLGRLALGKGPWLLIECPFSPMTVGIDLLLSGLRRRGHHIVLAHPERCPAFHRDPELLRRLVGEGLLVSVTAGSLVGQFGSQAKRFAELLFREQIVHNVVSDAHDDVRRPPSMSAELERGGFGALTEWLTEAVPAAILAGEERIPARPAASPAPRNRWSLRH